MSEGVSDVHFLIHCTEHVLCDGYYDDVDTAVECLRFWRSEYPHLHFGLSAIVDFKPSPLDDAVKLINNRDILRKTKPTLRIVD